MNVRPFLRWRALVIVWRTYGWRGLWRRARYETRRKGARFLAAPRATTAAALPQGALFYAPAGAWRDLPAEIAARIVERGRQVVAGRYEAYGHEWRDIPADARAWRTHPRTGYAFPAGPWWRVPHLPAGHDIKDVWEPGRCAWVYDLVRAYCVTGERQFADAFYAHSEKWWAANPPFKGPQWACGQETALRALALLHGVDALPAPHAGATQTLARVLHASGERIADAIEYALSQRNNHGLSEAAGLVHLGLRLRGAHPHAGRWLRDGKRHLEEQIRDQFAVDGWYAQHSFTYMRVALEQALVAQRVLLAAGDGLSAPALARVDAALALLGELVDGARGRVPNHGANDGGRVVLYSTADYRDFRPLLTLGAVLRERPLPADVQPDPEVLRWLGAVAPATAAVRGDGVLTGPSGWALARIGRSAVFVRAGEYSHRPSHLDALHLDVRVHGREVVTDAGSFAYNAQAPWNNGLATSFVHNGPVLDGRECAERGPRFLWLSWPRAQVLKAEFDGIRARLVAERPGAVRREVEVTADRVRVTDTVLDRAARHVQVIWLIHPDALNDFTVQATGAQRIAAGEGAVSGWFSPTYGLRRASTAVRVERVLTGDKTPLHTTIEPATRPT